MLTEHPRGAAGQIGEYAGPAGVPERFTKLLGRSEQFALDAAVQAVADAQITFNAENAYQVGALIGTAHGPGQAAGRGRIGSGLSGVTIGLNIAGPAFTIAADGASGLAAILQAADLIRSGAISAAIAGGAEAPLRDEVFDAYAEAGLLAEGADTDGQRPFDLQRRGMVLGEGAAVLLLEERSIAVKRGARIYAELTGGAQTAGPPADGQPPCDVDIARRAIGNAFRESGKAPAEVDLVLTAGVGTIEGDKRETDVLERSFGARIQDMYVTAVSPTVGYTVGAAGALSAVAGCFAIAEGVVPPHATYTEIDPECGLDLARKAQRDHLYGAVVSAYGTMGQNASLFIMRHQPEPGDEVNVLV
jgi:3-oxoacyl-(acyl-carrier-protein) synthase